MNKRVVFLLLMLFILITFSIFFLKQNFAVNSSLPEGCVYRNDAKGMSVLYETLSRNPDLQVLVHEDRFLKFSTYENATFIVYDLFFTSLYDKAFDDLAQLIYDGSTLIVLSENNYLVPNLPIFSEDKTKEEAEKESKEKSAPLEKDPEKDDSEIDLLEFYKSKNRFDSEILLSLKQLLRKFNDLDRKIIKPIENEHEVLKVNGRLWYKNWPEEFSVLFADKHNRPVILSAIFGKGKVCLVKDPEFFYNEYLVKHKDAAMIDKLFLNTPESRIVIDQTGLKIFVEKSIIGLIKRYHLIGVLYAVIFIGLLLFWRLLLENQFKSKEQNAEEEEISLYKEPMANVLSQYLSAEEIFKKVRQLHKSSYMLRNDGFKSRWEEVSKGSKGTYLKEESEICKKYNETVRFVKTGK